MADTRSSRPALGQGLFTRLILGAGLLFLLSPLLLLILFSFNASRNITQWSGFSLHWYREAFRDPILWICVRNSLLVALLSTALSTILGTMAALGLGRSRFRGQALLKNLLHLPILLPEIVLGIALLILFQLIRMPMGFLSVSLAHVTFSLSFVTLVILVAVRNLDPDLERAALDLGATPFQAFRDVLLPELAPGILSGALFAFCLSIDDFVVTFFTTGSGFTTFPLKVYSMLRYGVTPSINAVSTLLVLLTCIALGGIGLLKTLSDRLKGHWKGLLLASGTALGVLLLVLYLGEPSHARKLVFATYSDYLDESLVQDFQKETGIQLSLNYINDGNELITKLQAGSSDYDLLMVTDHLVSVATRLDLLQPYDFAQVPNYVHVPAEFRRLPFDPTGNFYLPYTYGLTAVAYNAEHVPNVDSWKIFWDPAHRNRITLIDEMRQAFSIPFLVKGWSINDTDPSHLEQAKQMLIEQKKVLRKYESNLVKEMLRSGEIHLAQLWTGEILRLNRENPKFRMAVPKEGCPLFVDTLCLRKGSPHLAEAQAFVNYLLRPEVAARNMLKICYAMPNEPARQQLPPEFRDSPILYPPMDGKGQYQTWKDVGPYLQDMNRAWTQVKGE